MKKRKYTRNLDRMRRYQGCMTDSVAYYFNIHPENVPLFVYPREKWKRRLKSYFRHRGYVIDWTRCNRPPKTGKHIIVGNSLRWKTASHMVVYRNGKLVYDPSYPSQWNDNRITHRLIVKKINV